MSNSQVKNDKASTVSQRQFTTKLEKRRKDKQEKLKTIKG